MKKAFGKSNWVLGSGTELIRLGWQPDDLMVIVESIKKLEWFTKELNLEVYLPIFGYGGESVLFAKDAEISLSNPSYLYHNVGSQLHFFRKHISPVILYETDLLEKHGVAHMIDLTPSGWHVLFRVRKGTNAFNRIASIGHLEEDLKEKYKKTDFQDLKRNPAPGVDAGLVFSGMGRLKEYMAFKALVHAERYEDIPITISDSEEKCVNEDITDTGDPGYMRIMRSPFSLHKKRRRYITGSHSLQDIIMRVYNGKGDSTNNVFIEDMDYLLNCMWNKEMAVEHSISFSGEVPEPDDESINSFVDEYESSELFTFHQNFDARPRLEDWEAFIRAKYDKRLDSKTHNFVKYPCPRALEPPALQKFVGDLLENGWHPKDIGCLIDDFYHLKFDNDMKEVDWGALDNEHKYSKITRANFWARTYSVVHMLKEKEISL